MFLFWFRVALFSAWSRHEDDAENKDVRYLLPCRMRREAKAHFDGPAIRSQTGGFEVDGNWGILLFSKLRRNVLPAGWTRGFLKSLLSG